MVIFSRYIMLFLFTFPFLVKASPFTLPAKSLDEDISVQISLPETYTHSNSFHYPVLVVLDGSTQFEHIAASVKFLSTYAIVPEMLVVGLSTRQRLKYFTPSEHPKFAGRSGQAEVFTQFIDKELFPFLKSKYRLADYRVISGHSLSGLYTSHLVLNKPSSFNAYISVSPSLWWDKHYLITHFPKTASPVGRRWYLSMASEPGEMAEGFNAMLDKLNTARVDNLYWSHARFPEETHDSTPLIANGQALKSLFKPWNAVPEIEVKSLQELRAFYRKITPEFGYQFDMSVHQYNVYGLKAAYEGKTEWGVKILEQGVKDFPLSDYLWDSLATAYQLNQQIEAAMSASNKALQLARGNASKYLTEIRSQNTSLKQQAGGE